LIELGGSSRAPQELLTRVAVGRVSRPRTAWHCCLEFYSVATRLPEEFRLTPQDALTLLTEEVLGRFDVFDLPAGRRSSFLAEAARDRLRGGRLYDAHIAAIARASGASTVVTENLRHFVGLEALGIRICNAATFLSSAQRSRR
jgi:predicted nucleic acid-binding protein